jgi:hypothetical protein
MSLQVMPPGIPDGIALPSPSTPPSQERRQSISFASTTSLNSSSPQKFSLFVLPFDPSPRLQEGRNKVPEVEKKD